MQAPSPGRGCDIWRGDSEAQRICCAAAHGSPRTGHSLVTGQQQESWARRRVLTCDTQEQGVAGVWSRIGRASEGAVAPVDPAVGWGPRTQRALSLECSVGALPSSEQAPKVLPSLSRWNWSKVCSELQSKVTFSPDLTTEPPWAEREGFLDWPGRRRPWSWSIK